MSGPVVSVKDLKKTFRIGFFRKRIDAVRGVSFKVQPGEIFGLLGPNGAGKTTTIKTILRLIFPSSGSIELFGEAPTRKLMARVGYMPENPYVYQYLRPLEFLDLCGRLISLSSAERRRRSERLLDQVGLTHAADRPIGKFSKGMMQRVGLAQALLSDPELLVLDEPMSGLDPIGRKEVRDVLLEQKRKGKTLLFTSHILSDVEMLCDRVVILQRGEVRSEGRIKDLLKSESNTVELELDEFTDELQAAITTIAQDVHVADAHLLVHLEQSQVNDALRMVEKHGAQVLALRPQRKSLESLFVHDAPKKESSISEANAQPPPP